MDPPPIEDGGAPPPLEDAPPIETELPYVPPPPVEDAPAVETEPPPAIDAPPPPPPKPPVHPRVAMARQAAGYERAVLALSGVLGAAHAVRIACAGVEDQTYRRRMQSLIDLEAPDGDDERRTRFVEAFNAAYQVEQGRHPACTAAAGRRESDLARQGRQHAQQLARLYASVTEAPAAPQTRPKAAP